MSLGFATYTDLNLHAQLRRLGIGNYEHLIYYLDTETRLGQAIMVETETLVHVRHCQVSSEVNPRHLSPAMPTVYMVPWKRDIQKTGA